MDREKFDASIDSIVLFDSTEELDESRIIGTVRGCIDWLKTEGNLITDNYSEFDENDFVVLNDVKDKDDWLKRKIAQFLETDYGQKIAKEVERMLVLVQKVRVDQGIAEYTQGAIYMMTCEIIYSSYLWRGIKRKTGTEFSFDTHQIEAFLNAAMHGFTGMPNLLAAIKHDDLEDLAIHQDFSDANGNVYDHKEEWLFCDEIYREKVIELEGYDVTQIIDKIIVQATDTIRALTSPEVGKGGVATGEKRISDERKAFHYLENLLTNGYAATIKVIEQIQNAQTLGGLGPERARKKIELILILHGLFAKILELSCAERLIITAGVSFLRPEFMENFLYMQKSQIAAFGYQIANLIFEERRQQAEELLETYSQHLDGIASEHCESELDLHTVQLVKDLLLRIARDEIGECRSDSIEDLFKKLIDSSLFCPEDLDLVRNDIRSQIFESVRPLSGTIRRIELRPSSIANFIDVEKILYDKDYKLQIPINSLLFEIVILVDDEEHIPDIVSGVVRAVYPEQECRILPDASLGRTAQLGAKLQIKKNTLGGIITIRVNTVKQEAMSKRGIRAIRGEPIPSALRKKIRRVLKVVTHTGQSVFDVAEEVMMREQLTVYSDEQDHKPVRLNSRATFFDFSAALPGSIGLEALAYGRAAYYRRENMLDRRRIDFCEELKDGDLCYIEIDKTKPSRLSLMDFVFSREEHTRELGAQWFSKCAVQEKEEELGRSLLPSEKRKVCEADRMGRANLYLQKLCRIFDIDEYEIFLFFSYNSIVRKVNAPNVAEKPLEESAYRKSRRNLLCQIGNLNFNPLYPLTDFISDRSLLESANARLVIPLSIVVADQPGVLAEISALVAKKNINMRFHADEPYQSEEGEAMSKLRFDLEIPKSFFGYDLLKLILRLEYKGAVKVEANLFDFSSVEDDLRGIGVVTSQ